MVFYSKNNPTPIYLNNKDLYIEIIVSKAQGKLTRNAEKMLELLAKKTIKKIKISQTKLPQVGRNSEIVVKVL